MTLRQTLTLARAALRSLRYVLDGRVRFPRDRLGYVLEQSDGDAFTVYRETAVAPVVADTSEDRVVLVFGMRVRDREAGGVLRRLLFDPLANVATPFYAGMPGFRRKLWLAGERPGEFLELYEWATAEDADRFVAVLRSLLRPFEFAGTASFEVVEDDTIDQYVAADSVRWRSDVTGLTGRRRRQLSLGALLLVVIVPVVGVYLAWRRTARRRRAGTHDPGE